MIIHNICFPYFVEKFKKYPYCKCPNISNTTKVSDRMAYANSADPDQTEQSDQHLHFRHSTKYFTKQLHKKAKFRPK